MKGIKKTALILLNSLGKVLTLLVFYPNNDL